MEEIDPTECLGPDDQLSLWVGRIARAHALLEYTLSNVHGVLTRADAGPGPLRRPPGFDQLVRECKRLLERSGSPPPVVASGRQALAAARQANAERNRALHDLWLDDAESGSAPTWITSSRLGSDQPYETSERRGLVGLVATHALLVRTRFSVSGLFMALHTVLPDLAEGAKRTTDETSMPRYVAMMTDQFEIEANGDITVRRTS